MVNKRSGVTDWNWRIRPHTLAGLGGFKLAQDVPLGAIACPWTQRAAGAGAPPNSALQSVGNITVL
jgi:hypothetical protein